MKLSYLVRGFPGHPAHPPLTDATIGAYTFATVAALLDVTGIAEQNGARAWWLALVVGLIFSAPTVVTGLADWLTIAPGTPLKRTVNTHALVMAAASLLFVLAVILGRDDYKAASLDAGPFLLTVVGYATLAIGGWIGGSIVFVHGLRVEKERAEG